MPHTPEPKKMGSKDKVLLCPDCGGHGYHEGVVHDTTDYGDGLTATQYERVKRACKTCGGSGLVQVVEVIKPYDPKEMM